MQTANKQDRPMCWSDSLVLRTLEKMTERVDKFTVFGLDGVLKDVVRIQVPAN